MFVDELEISARAGDGGDGVVRWLQLKFQPKGGPAGGNGGKGGDVYIEAVADINRLAKYTGYKEFAAQSGEDGKKFNRFGRQGDDCVIAVPVGSVVRDVERGRTYELNTVGDREKILNGGAGGLGNTMFKSSTNTAPTESTEGKPGEQGRFLIEVRLAVDVGLIGLPNAGKSTLLNALTNASATVGAYPFTTIEPNLGALYGIILADIPGLIDGASTGKGLGHKFLRHVSRTKMLVHCLSLENEDIAAAYQTIRNELSQFDQSLSEKEEWVVLTKSDIAPTAIDAAVTALKTGFTIPHIFVVSAETGEGIKEFQDALVAHVRSA